MKNIGIIGNKRGKNFCNYRAVVEAVNANVVELDPYDVDQDLKKKMKGIDGLIIPGGLDIQPSYFHEKNIACGELDPKLDDYEMKVLSEAVSMQIPVLGICRGHQLINVFFHGSLYQDISCSESHKRRKDEDRVHITKLDHDGFVYDIYKSDKIYVNSAHHQAIKKLGDDLIPVQYSEEGIVEAVQHKFLPIFGVQWHPERMCLANKRDDTVSGLDLIRFFALKH